MSIRDVYHGLEIADTAPRPVIRGRHLVVSSGHYLASLAGMRMYERGGNAVDAGVAAAFAQTVLEFQSCGFGGEIPILMYSAASEDIAAINGNMRAPAGASIEWFRQRHIDLIPSDGFLPAGVCAAPDALITALDRYGTLTLKDVLAPAIALAADGFPIYEGMRSAIVRNEERFRREWPTSAALFLPEGRVPALGDTWRNRDLARTFERLVEAEDRARPLGRSASLRAARDRFYQGDIAQEIVAFQQETVIRDANGVESGGLLTIEDFAQFETRVERPLSVNYRGYDVYKCGPWSQGPVFLQQLNLLEGFDLGTLGHNSADYVHTVIEVAKLAFADRERYYGDPEFVAVPLNGLLSKAYAAARRELIDPRRASLELRPGNPYPFEGSGHTPDLTRVTGRAWVGGTTGTRAIDGRGNMYSGTPSGGWFHSSPVIPGLGFCLGTRGQMFWLGDSDHPAALRPRKRPRTTLSPSLVMKGNRPCMVFGTPGGDQQDQWTLQFFLSVVDFRMNVQDAVEAAGFHTNHFPSSFYPRDAHPGEVVVETRVGEGVLDELRARGHSVVPAPLGPLGGTTAVIYDPDRGVIEGGASSRGARNYAIGW
ncbi:MAG: gamma-glutamyltransferase family protein [Armatimonadota bacterium]